MSEGAKHDDGKIRMDLLPVEALEALGRVLSMGAHKYGDRNWENGINYGRVYGALLRHLLSWWKREDIDPESRLNHLDHVLANAAFLRTYVRRGMAEFDDRPGTIPPAEYDWVQQGVELTTEQGKALEDK